jgi:hypothetical protein
MKTLKEIIRDIKNISTTLYEASLLDEIEDTLSAGDDVIKKYKQAEKDWKKLLKTRRFVHSYGDQYIVKCISPELVEFFGKGIPSYERWKDRDLYMCIAFNLSDALSGHNYARSFQLQIVSKSGYLITSSDIEYCSEERNNKFAELTRHCSDYSVPTKEGCNDILDVITSLKELQDLESAKKLFINNLLYERN